MSIRQQAAVLAGADPIVAQRHRIRFNQKFYLGMVLLSVAEAGCPAPLERFEATAWSPRKFAT